MDLLNRAFLVFYSILPIIVFRISWVFFVFREQNKGILIFIVYLSK